MPRCIIMRGIPGSGKSTLAKTMGCDIVSADDYFTGSGEYKFNPSLLGEAHRACMKAFLQHVMHADRDVLVDNTNINLEDIAPYVAVAEASGYDVTIIQLDVEPEVGQRNVHGVDLHTLKNMHYRLQNTRLPKRWKVIKIGSREESTDLESYIVPVKNS